MEVKLLILDVDGTLTDGGIYIGSDKTETKRFQAKDGLIVRVFPKLGIRTLILTGRYSDLTQIRADDLSVSFVIQGVGNKVEALGKFMLEHNIAPEHIAYIGDDLNDFAAMQLCCFRACPNDAANEIKKICDYTSPLNGGQGAVRDCCEFLLKKTGKYDAFLKTFDVVHNCI